jgi:hypothetical protein
MTRVCFGAHLSCHRDSVPGLFQYDWSRATLTRRASRADLPQSGRGKYGAG